MFFDIRIRFERDRRYSTFQISLWQKFATVLKLKYKAKISIINWLIIVLINFEVFIWNYFKKHKNENKTFAVCVAGSS